MTSGLDRLEAPLPLPAPGRATCVQGAGLQLVLEQERGGLRLLSHDGLYEATHHLAKPAAGTLHVRWLPPRHPITILLREDVVLPPGSHLSGFVVLPMCGEILLRANGGTGAPLLELIPTTLRLAWRSGAYGHEAVGHWIRRWNRHLCTNGLVVPVRLVNQTPDVVRPTRLELPALQPDGLRLLRDQIVAAPRRIRFGARGETETSERRWPRSGRR